MEWQRVALKFQDKKLVSIYFGGGTPTLFGAKAIGDLLNVIRQDAILDPSCEITIEANPESATPELLSELYQVGINRISIGAQSLDDSSLLTLGREHSANKAVVAIENSYKAGICNISIDLMYDLPSQTLQSWERTLKQVQKLPITHLSLYNLTIEPHTVFFKNKKTLNPLLPNAEESLKMLEMAVDNLETFGLKRYEISAFAKEGFHSRHNTGYWEGRPFIGLGPSAFSYWDKKRFRNVASLSKYHAALTKDESPVDFVENLPYPEDIAELLAIQLRLLKGVDLEAFATRNGQLAKEMEVTLLALQEKGWLAKEGERLKLTENGLLFYDSVAEEIVYISV